jgi:hypothetical protein
MSKNKLILILLTLLLIKAPLVQAEKLPIFKVEIIIFESLALKGWTEEHWPIDIDKIDTKNAIYLPSLPKTSNLLNQQAKKMTRRMGYNILLHKSWLVEAKSEKNARPILLRVEPISEYSSSIDGQLTFYKSRYPHIKLNLELERIIPEKIKEIFSKQQNIELEYLPSFWKFQLKESRKINSNQLHYIDHPLFGALVQIKWQQ